MKRNIAFIFIFLVLIFIPLIFFDKKSVASKNENRNLAVLPPLIENGNLNPLRTHGNCYDSYFSDRFGFREKYIFLSNSISHKLSEFDSVMINELALKGKSGWYFYIRKDDGDNASDFLKTNLFSDEELENLKSRIQNAAAFCELNNIKFLFVIGPNKHSVYSEFYPFARPEGKTRADQITQVFDELKVPYVFPRDYLLSLKTKEKVPLYYETDTHWNPLGAYHAFEKILPIIKSDFPKVQFPQIEYKTTWKIEETSHDILPMLGIEKAKTTEVHVLPADGNQNYTYLQNEGVQGVHTISQDKNLPRALIFRDSFFGALEPFTSPLFSEAEYIWKTFGDEDKARVLEFKPDIIIFEAVERVSPAIVH